MIQKVRLDDIRIRLFDENQTVIPHKIENTPHYKLLSGDRKPYDYLINSINKFISYYFYL